MADTLDIQAIRAIAEAATPGPRMAAASPSSVVGWPIVGAMGRSIGDVSWLPTIKHGTAAYAEIEANANFIAAARTIVPALCDEVERLRSALCNIDAVHREELTGIATQTRQIVRNAIGDC